MKGQILDFSVQEGKGIITTDDGKRYSFEGKEWRESIQPTRGLTVDFDTNNNGDAVSVYKALKGNGINLSNLHSNGTGTDRTKSKITAGLFALFLGGFGAHKFYLGMPIPGIVYLVTCLLSGMLAGATDDDIFFLFSFAIGIFSLIDAVIYFTRSDDDFQRIYVEEKRQWF